MWGGCWGRCGDADACVLFIFDLLTRAAVGDGLTGNRVGSQSDMVSTAQRLLYAGAASLMCGSSGVVLEGLGWAVRPNHFAPV